MAGTTKSTPRADVDIQADIHDIIAHYPPLNADRQHIHVDVTNGVVFLHGHVRTPINRRYLRDHVALVPGVVQIDDLRLFDDETMRLDAGRLLPAGVIANVQFGIVVLSGKLPEAMSEEAVASRIARIPGIQRIVTQLSL